MDWVGQDLGLQKTMQMLMYQEHCNNENGWGLARDDEGGTGNDNTEHFQVFKVLPTVLL